MRTELTCNEMMAAVASAWTQFVQDETGQDLIEYALVAALVGLGAVASIKTIGTKLASVFTGVSTSVNSAV